MTPDNWFRLAGNLTNLALIILSLRSFRMPVAFYIRLFAILAMVEQAAEFILLIPAFQVTLKYTAANLVTVCEWSVYAYIFLKVIRWKLYRLVLCGFLVLSLFYYLFWLIKEGPGRVLPHPIELFQFLLLTMGSLIYFRENFTYRRDSLLTKDFDFWFMAGAGYYFATSLFTDLALYYLGYVGVKNLDYYFGMFMSSVFVVSNLFYCKAFLCIRKPSLSS